MSGTGKAKQVIKTDDELRSLYEKLKLPPDFAFDDHQRNMQVPEAC